MTNPTKIVTLKVYVANLHAYTNGTLQGTWLNLPTSKQEITRTLKSIDITPGMEYAIHDHISEFSIGEYEQLHHLNIIAEKLTTLTQQEIDVAAAYCNYNGYKTTLEIFNVLQQLDEIQYITVPQDSFNRQRNLAYAWLEQGMNDILNQELEKDTPLSRYFDYEAYGHDLEIEAGYWATDEIFILYHSEPDPTLYKWEDLPLYPSDQ